jgi:hypothetical protein
MDEVRGHVVHCGRFGCIVRLEDGRLGVLAASELGIDTVKRAVGSGQHPSFPFAIAEQNGRRVRLQLARATALGSPASPAPNEQPVRRRLLSSFEEKIIDFWRQASDWDRNAGRVEPDERMNKRTERLLPFEERAPREHTESFRRPRQGPKRTRRNRS